MFTLKGNFLRSFKNSRAAAMYIKQKSNSTVEVIRSAIKNNCLGTVNSAFGYF